MTTFYKTKPCRNCGCTERYFSNRKCPTCAKSKSKEYRLDNPEVYREASKRRRSDKPIEVLAVQRASRDKHSDTVRASRAKRRAAKLNRTPIWLTKDHLEEIKDYYTAAEMFRQYTGEQYHVDHVVPLQGENVSGLHVPWNLQVLPAKENLMKSNKEAVNGY